MAEEKRFENKVKNYIEEIGGWFIKYWAGSKYTKEGVPDILACIKGKFYAIEVKSSNGRPSLLQLVALRKVREAGGIGVLLYQEDFKFFVQLVAGLEIGEYWYRDNCKKQQKMFEKLNG